MIAEDRCGVFDFLGRQCTRGRHHAFDHLFLEERAATDFELVGSFHRKFGLPDATGNHDPHLIAKDVAAFRWRFLMEELTELLEAMNHDDLPGIADALVDIVYVALGTAHYYGLPWQELFAEVQRANMLKERALDHPFKACDKGGCDNPGCHHVQGHGDPCAKPAELHSKRGSALDVVKPPGWQPPDLAAVLRRNGWDDPRNTRRLT